MSSVFTKIARCPEHGLHGERDTCYVCDGPVEQVDMMMVDEAERRLEHIVRAVVAGVLITLATITAWAATGLLNNLEQRDLLRELDRDRAVILIEEEGADGNR